MSESFTCPEPRPGDIAVVGVGCRFPGGVRDLDSLWTVLADGMDVITEVPSDRWDQTFHDPDPRNPGTTYSREGGFLTDIDRFDAEYFGISPREAREMDPQQRLLLEVTAEAMEDSGVPRADWSGTRTSVHMGILASDYLLLHTKTAGTAAIDPYFASGKEFSFAAGRIAYTFGLHGPTMAVNTACSSSLVAVHLACQALRAGEADSALAGGVNAILAPELTVFMGKVQALSPTGRCKPFDARADGVVRGEGCGVVVLKRYPDALRDGDRIHGVIRGSAVNQDGFSAGLTAPNAEAQQALLRTALDAADLSPRALAYVEAHGTGTPLGDPLEISALTEVVSRGREGDQRLIVGSHKANFGHMDSAAGIAGLLKTLLVLRHGTVPPQIHHESASPLIDWDRSGIVIPTTTLDLPGEPGSTVAGVSAFGLSGTNAHILLTGPPAEPDPSQAPGGAADTDTGPEDTGPEDTGPGDAGPAGGPPSLVLSASTAAGLRQLADDYHRLLAGREDAEPRALEPVLATAALRRTRLAHRLAVTTGDRAELTAALAAFRDGEAHPAAVDAVATEDAPPVVYVFSGQGSQWPGMAADLYDREPVARQTLDACEELIARHAGWSLLQALRDPDAERLKDTAVAQPAVFAVQMALARLWESWGVRPDAVVGHSMGEVAAACVAGALTLSDATRLIVDRGRLMQRATGTGRMVSVDRPADEIRDHLVGHPEVRVATVNGPALSVIAGPPEPVERAVAELKRYGASTIALPVTYAFHSPLMKPHGDALESLLSWLEPAEPTLPFLSTAVPGATRLDAGYWGANVREPVLFWPTVDQWLAERDAVFVEIGAHPVLSRPLRSALAHRDRSGTVVGSLVRGQDGPTQLARSRARLHVAGVAVDWSAAFPRRHRPVSLPPHRWAEERYWLDGVARGSQSSGQLSEGLRAEVRLYDAHNRLIGQVSGTPGPVTEPAGSGAPAALAPAGAPVATPATPSAAGRAAASAPAPGPSAPRPGPSRPAEREQVAAAVSRALAVVLGHQPDKKLPRGRGFFELGVDSVSVSEVAKGISEALGVEVDGPDVLGHASVDALTEHILTLGPVLAGAPTASAPAAQPPAAAPRPVQPAADATANPTASPDPWPVDGPEPIAVIGIGCRLPGGVDTPEGFWRLLADRTDATGEVPRVRWDARALLDAEGATPGSVVTTRGAFLDHVDGFDHGFFRVSPREARSMDPQQRLLLEVAWESLEDAGVPAHTLRGSRTGVFVGLNTTDYQQLVTERADEVDLYYGTGNSFSGSAGRLSYFLGTRGPSMAVDTACSSSLTAVHLACQSLRTGESEVAIAGGVNVMSTPTVFRAMSAAGALAPDGRCKTFDDSADGYGRGEGAGAVVLKPLSTARRDGDRVYAVIRGSAVNQDGASGGLTVPSGEAQQEVIAAALTQARVSAAEVDYVEAHGTGTRLGDAIELRALAGALGDRRDATDPLLVGSVKTNVGHLEAAAGVTGLIKVALAMQHQEIPAHLHVDAPTRQVPWDRLPVRVTTEATPWPRGERPRIAGISAFGFTGTNAHVLLQEPPSVPAPPAAPASPANRPYVLTASAVTPAALSATAERLRERVAATDVDTLPDLCWAAGARRTHHEYRLAVRGSSRRELVEGLAAAARAESAKGVRLGTARPGEYRSLAFVYGRTAADLPWDQLLTSAAEGAGGAFDTLFGADPEGARAFRGAVGEVDAALVDALGFSPIRVWTRAEAAPEPDTARAAALTFAGHLAMNHLWAALGVVPDAVVGYDLGELTAACTAGELGVAEAAGLLTDGPVSYRGQGSGTLPRHSAAVGWPALADRLATDGVEVALDIGTGSSAAHLLRAAAEGRGADVLVLTTPAQRGPRGQRRSTAGVADLVDLAATLHVHGCRVDFDRLVPGRRRVVSLPPYAWQRRSHWIAPLPQDAPAAPEAGQPTPDRPTTEATLVDEVRALRPEAREERLLQAVLGWVSETLGGADDVAPEQGFFELGMDSVLSNELKRHAERALGCELPGTVMFECPNARSFVRFLLEEVVAEPVADAPAPVAEESGTTTDPDLDADPEADPDDGLDDLDDEALLGRALSLLSSSETLLTEGD